MAELKRLSREADNLQYAFDPETAPRLTVALDESFVLETEDALSGHLLAEGTRPTPADIPPMEVTPARLNPLTGPVYVEGVSRGDLLAVTIERIEPAAFGVALTIDEIGPGWTWRRWDMFNSAKRFRVDHQPGASGTTRDGRLTIGDFSWRLNPHLGCLGVAPEWLPESTLTSQTPHGGNWDNRHVCEGATVYFNAYHDGALLCIGDMHAAQGDCEFFGAADETRGEVQVRCGVVKDKQIPFPRIETEDRLIQMACYRPLEEAVRMGTRWLMEWLRDDYGVSEEEAFWLVEINPDFRVTIGNMVTLGRIEYTVSVEVTKSSLERA